MLTPAVRRIGVTMCLPEMVGVAILSTMALFVVVTLGIAILTDLGYIKRKQ